MENVSSLAKYDRLADRVRLHKQADKRSVILVEGRSDSVLLSHSISVDCAYFPAGTRSLALDAAQQLHSWKMGRFACIVDRDFDDTVELVEGKGVPVFPYENADLEAMLSSTISKPLMAMLDELASQEKLAKWGGKIPFLRSVQSAVVPVAILRRANAEENWGIKFDGVDLASKVDRSTLKIKVQPYCAALSATVDNSPSQAELIEYVNGVRVPRSTAHCPRGAEPYYRGRDLLAVLGVALRSAAGSCGHAITEVEHLAKMLRLTAAGMISDSSWATDLVQMVI